MSFIVLFSYKEAHLPLWLVAPVVVFCERKDPSDFWDEVLHGVACEIAFCFVLFVCKLS